MLLMMKYHQLLKLSNKLLLEVSKLNDSVMKKEQGDSI